jgi:hypothetical protein
MLLKVGNSFLDFDEDVEVENISKIFEEIDFTYGDFSYSFDIGATSPNLEKLGMPQLADISEKTIYKNIDADLCDDGGLTLYRGQLRIESVSLENKTITCSFYSGNYNWISLITGNVNDLDFSSYDTELTVTNITNSWSVSEGMVFPLLDNGALVSRSHDNVVPEDFNGCMYVKTIFNKIFFSEGIKIQGELLNDWVYTNMIICKNNKDQEEIEANACYVQKSTTTTRVVENTDYKMIFQNDSTFPYFDGSNGSFDLANSRYVAPYDMSLRVEVHLEPDIVDASYNNRIRMYINGAFTFVDIGLASGGLYNSSTPGDQDDFVYDRVIFLQGGDILEVYSNWQQSLGSTQNDVLSGSWKITPLFIGNVKGSSAVPAWTKQEFVANILNLFNVVTDYNPFTKTITFNLFDKISYKPAIDISKYIQVNEIDYSEFISSYGKQNIFQYQEGEDEELRDYNVTKFIKYGSGKIQVDNDFIPESKIVINSKFKTPISYINGVFACSLERINFMEMSESDSVEITSVSDSLGEASFNVAANPYLIGDFVRISDCNVNEYNGDWRVSARTVTSFELQGVTFTESGTGEAKKITHTPTNSDDVFLFINIPNISIANFSEQTNYLFPSSLNTITSLSIAYFNILENGQPVNTGYLQGLSFGGIDNEFSYQKNLLDTYWRNFSSILSDPVKLKVKGHFPKSVFLSLTPLTPVYIKSSESTNLYYVNRKTGYKASHLPCEVELIKL